MNILHNKSNRIEIKIFLEALLDRQIPVFDVRSPLEYARAHVPGAVNLPLFDDAGRAEVGTVYKQVGKQEAMLLALRLVGPRLEMLAKVALEYAAQDKDKSSKAEVVLYCARGGMRSASMAWLLQTLGLKVHVLEGGYKTFRRFVLECFEAPHALCVLGGKTGSGKTHVLEILAEQGRPVIDLEGLAKHRGSAFGALPEEQPSTEHFENCLALDLFKLQDKGAIWVEDESENLGRVNIPRSFFKQLREAPLVVMETSREARIARVLEEYALFPKIETAAALDRIRKRLGGLEHKRAHAFLAEGDLAGVANILLDYYDKAYLRQLVDRNIVETIYAETPIDAVGWITVK